jgi:HEPN domain-containing protein
MKKATEAWLDFAHRDLEAAKLLVDHEYVSNAVLFHSQQCLEKCLKALLEEAYSQTAFPTHGRGRHIAFS